jgi:tellurite resistance protein
MSQASSIPAVVLVEPRAEPSRVGLPIVPAAFFGMVLGLAGLGGTWRVAHQVWNLPEVIGEALMAFAALVWLILIVLFAMKWVFAFEEAHREAHHPVQCCFIGLAGVTTMLMALAVLPYSRIAAESAFAIGALYTLIFALWRTGLLWRGERDHEATTPVLYLPTVAGGFVAAIVASALGYEDWAELAFGVALFSWFAIESVLIHRLYTATRLQPSLRPVLGIQIAPPAVGALAYLSINGGHPDMFAHALLGYALMQTLLMLRSLRWIMEQPFNTSYWSFTFGVTALATAALRMAGHGDTGATALLEPWLFAGANVTVGLIFLGSLWLLSRGRLLPQQAHGRTI